MKPPDVKGGDPVLEQPADRVHQENVERTTAGELRPCRVPSHASTPASYMIMNLIYGLVMVSKLNCVLDLARPPVDDLQRPFVSSVI